MDVFQKHRFQIHAERYRKPTYRNAPNGNAEGAEDGEEADIQNSKSLEKKHKWLGQLYNVKRELQPLSGSVYSDKIKPSVVGEWVTGLRLKFEIEFDISVCRKEDWDLIYESVENLLCNTPPEQCEAAITAAKHPVGVPVTPYCIYGESYLQMRMLYTYRTEFWVAIYAFVKFVEKSAKDVEKEQYYDNEDVKRKLSPISEGIMKILNAMQKVGISCITDLNKASIVGLIDKAKLCSNDREKELLGKIKAFIKPKSHWLGAGKFLSETEFIVWGPHLFETYLKHRIINGLHLHSYGVENRPISHTLVHEEYGLIPDILIYKNTTNAIVQGSYISIFDAKLYNHVWDTNKRTFAVKMDAYLNAFCSTGVEHNQRRGITFVALYGDQGGWEEIRKNHLYCAFNVCSKEWDSIKDKFNELLKKALNHVQRETLAVNMRELS
ncbi:hypothetical protein PSENEW3n2_00000617 [Picochlorum sp. SENEW3]|nr:hypothetical protein PSENEW3n2_00000617 [Picochlorum sp. SENEW3]WPT15537.1 hypothetical protein PSENEW3_00000617 [Picochlorum sp. SENEW3]